MITAEEVAPPLVDENEVEGGFDEGVGEPAVEEGVGDAPEIELLKN